MHQIGFYTLWAINGALDERRLCGQLDQMRAWGFDGTVFHPRFYPNVPPYLSDEYLAILSRTILYAQSIGMEFWIYDENGWPSGTVGGELLKRYPEDAQHWADLTQNTSENVVASFEHQGKKWNVLPRRGPGVDYLNPQLAQHFLQLTYERYRTGLDPTAFEYVSTFFSDEPEFGLGHAFDARSPHGSIPWTPRLPELYQNRHGQKLESALPLLFVPGDGYREIRTQFWELLTDLFCDSFIAPIDQWCRKHGKRFTAHVKGEEHPLFQAPMVGSCHQVFQRLGLPGIDALERYPSGHFFPRQVASAAQQFGDGTCMVECFGGAAWGATPEDLQRYLDWLAGHGLTHFVVHLYQYELTTHAIHDWPASTPAHVNWRDAYPQLLERIRRKATQHSTRADTLVIAPYRGIMEEYEPRELLQTNIHNASTYPDTPAGRINRSFLELLDRVHRSEAAYHISDERTVEQHGRADSGLFHLGNCAYRNIVIGGGTRLNAKAQRLLSGFTTQPAFEPRASPISIPTPLTTVEIEWRVAGEIVNSLVLEAKALADSRFAAAFHSEIATDLKIQFVDEVQDVTFNSVLTTAPELRRCIAGRNEIRFASKAGGLTPFVVVHGPFGVRSLSEFVPGPNNTVATKGPFVISEIIPFQSRNLIAAGFPFCRNAIALQGTLVCSSSFAAIRFTEIAADCLRVSIDGKDHGWCWGPDWTIRLSSSLNAGSHRIQIQAVPNTFNFYGPHHHIRGDIPAVSPAQYEYVKNFADRPDGPESTRSIDWHLKPFGIGNRLELHSKPRVT